MYFHYTYDAVGNRVIEATNVLTSVYGYDDLNRLVYYNGLNYAWDDNGNLLNDGVNSYTYDRANRLIGVSPHAYRFEAWEATSEAFQYHQPTAGGCRYNLTLVERVADWGGEAGVAVKGMRCGE